MAKSPEVRSSGVQFDGALLVTHQTGKFTLATTAAVDNVGEFVAPCDLTIVRMLIHTIASSTASAKIAVGNGTASDAFHDDILLKNNAAAAVIDVDMTVATGKWTKVTLTKGQRLKIKGNAIAGGQHSATFVFAPTTGQA